MIDFKHIISTTDKYNFHSHTQFCDGRAKMEVFVIEAINQGFTHLGFSPHSPIPLVSPCNMSIGDVPTYINEIKRLKNAYSHQIEIFASMEIDYLNDDWCASNDYFSSLPLDYKLSSIHFIPSLKDKSIFVDIDGSPVDFKRKMNEYFENDIRYVVTQFYNQTLKMIEKGGFDVICHFDKIANNANSFQNGIEDTEWYKKIVKDVFDSILDHKLVIEVNTKAFSEYQRFFPNQRYFNWLKDCNNTILINSDVHYPERINYGRCEAIKLLCD